MMIDISYTGLTDVQVWLTGVAYAGLIVSLYSYSLFLYVFGANENVRGTDISLHRPTIVTGLGYSGGAAQLHTVPPYVPAVVLTGIAIRICTC